MRKVSEYFSSFENAGKKLAKFHKLNSPGEKVEMVLQALRAHPTYMKASSCLPRGSLQLREGGERSKQLREQGNKLYQSKRFPEAIRMYTEAALLAGFDSDGKSLEAALAIGNRSAVYFHQRDWRRCEDDLEAAMIIIAMITAMIIVIAMIIIIAMIIVLISAILQVLLGCSRRGFCQERRSRPQALQTALPVGFALQEAVLVM